MMDIAVVVTCHAPYLHWLPGLLASIDRQQPPPSERVVVFDRCAPPPGLPEWWRTLTCDWGRPAEPRNAGAQATSAPWVIFFDADDVMPSGYLGAMQQAIAAAAPDVAIVYPSLRYCDDALQPGVCLQAPAWDYWSLREENYIGTPSAWRRAALDMVGGWSAYPRTFEDYALALELTAAGWKAARLDGPAVLVRQHPHSQLLARRDAGGWLADIYLARSLAIVTPLAGRVGGLNRWRDFLLRAALPPRTALYVVDNSGRPEFGRLVVEACERLQRERNLGHVDISTRGRPYASAAGETYLTEGRHHHVARLYAGVLPRVTEDLVLTLEDDMAPPLEAVQLLGQQIGYRSRARIGAVAAAYTMPHDGALVCAGTGPHGWGATVTWANLGVGPADVNCVGGGCTVWANWALRHAVAQLDWQHSLGWDATLCEQLRRLGYRIQLHGGVRAEHHLGDRLAQDAVARATLDAPPLPAPTQVLRSGATDARGVGPPEAPCTDATEPRPVGGLEALPSGATDARGVGLPEALRTDATETRAVGGLEALPSGATEPRLVGRLEGLLAEWRQHALAGEASTEPAWEVDEGGVWDWLPGQLRVRGSGTEWSVLRWPNFGSLAMHELGNFVVEVTVAGTADAAGVSFGPYKDCLVRLNAGPGPFRLQVEADAAAGTWAFRVDGVLMHRVWWDAALHSAADVLAGVLSFKARSVQAACFSDFSVTTFDASCQLSVVLCCNRYLQRLRLALRNWCEQSLPSGAYEVLVVNPGSPDGTHEHLAAVAAGYPHMRIREITAPPEVGTNKGAMINTAVRSARGRWIWLTDADCLFPPAAAATVVDRIGRGENRLWYGRRLFLSTQQTAALLSGRLDPVRDFAALAESPAPKTPDALPWGYTQIVRADTLREIRYREDIHNFSASDEYFWRSCQARGIRAEQIAGLACLHLDHPFAWYGTQGFL